MLSNLRKFLIRLQKFGISVNTSKCNLGVTEIEYLGHIVSKDGIAMSSRRKEGFAMLQPPTTLAQLRSFLGVANYFRDFIPSFASRTANMYSLCSPKWVFEWSSVHQNKFDDIKSAVLSAPMLYHIDYSLEIVKSTDASTEGVGAVLLQPDSTGFERTVCFLSKKFSAAAKKWATIDQEAFAIFLAVTTWSYYLHGHSTMEISTRVKICVRARIICLTCQF